MGKRVEYYHNDHLGNVRLAFSDLNGDGSITTGDIYDPGNEVTQERHYYPFGLTHTGPWYATVAPDNAYRYNGKELDEATGHYFYGFRMYDPAIARFTGVDPIADQFAHLSVYNYASNDPILNIDLHGLQGVDSNTGEVDGPDSDFTVFFQYDGRLSCGVTGCLSLGVAFDTEGNAAIYWTGAVGGGPVEGASTSWSVGISTADNVSEISGIGLNFGAIASAGLNLGAALGAEINLPYQLGRESSGNLLTDLWGLIDIGTTITPPVQFGLYGEHFGVYGEASWTNIIDQGSYSEILTDFYNTLQSKFSVNVSNEDKSKVMEWLSKYMGDHSFNTVEEIDP